MVDGFYPDPGLSLAVGGVSFPLVGDLTLDDVIYNQVRNRTLYFNGSTTVTVTNTSTAWLDGDTLGIINDGTAIARVLFASASPALGPFVTSDLYPGEAVIFKIAAGQWVEITRKATPDKYVVESLALATTTGEYGVNPATKFDETLALKGGKYKIKLHFEAYGDAGNHGFEAALFIDDVQFQGEVVRTATAQDNRYWPTKNARTAELSEGPHTFRLDFGKHNDGSSAVAYMRNATLVVESER